MCNGRSRECARGADAEADAERRCVHSATGQVHGLSGAGPGRRPSCQSAARCAIGPRYAAIQALRSQTSSSMTSGCHSQHSGSSASPYLTKTHPDHRVGCVRSGLASASSSGSAGDSQDGEGFSVSADLCASSASGRPTARERR